MHGSSESLSKEPVDNFLINFSNGLLIDSLRNGNHRLICHLLQYEQITLPGNMKIEISEAAKIQSEIRHSYSENIDLEYNSPIDESGLDVKELMYLYNLIQVIISIF